MTFRENSAGSFSFNVVDEIREGSLGGAGGSKFDRLLEDASDFSFGGVEVFEGVVDKTV